MKIFLVIVLLSIAGIFQPASGSGIVSPVAFAGVNRRQPPIGARYEKAIKLPVLGKQVFSLHIIRYV